jgi:hypothetical protein
LDDVEDLISSPEQAREVLAFLGTIQKTAENFGTIAGSILRINEIQNSFPNPTQESTEEPVREFFDDPAQEYPKSGKDIHLQNLILALGDKMEACDIRWMARYANEILEVIKLLESAAPVLDKIIEYFQKKIMTTTCTMRSLEYARIIRALVEKF